MADDNNNQNDHPTDEQPPDDTQTEYSEISDEELKQILEEHTKWLESDGKEGKKADFYKSNLQKRKFPIANLHWASFHKAQLQEANLIKANLLQANLIEAELQRAELWGANLKKTDLRRANLQEANLNNTNLKKADLHRANLQEAHLVNAKLQNANLSKVDLQDATLDGIRGLNEAKSLQYVNFQGATGLLGNEFAQADVTGTKLPDDIKEFKALETVKETSQNARKIFFAMLLGCVYSWLTIATTTDVRLLTNNASSPLPIIGTEIPIAWFYIAAPLIIISLYFYFHLYLDNLWGALAGLPAIFPDGKRLDERAYPWLLNTLVRKHFKRLKNRSLISRMKEWITILLAWCVVPFTMIAFWLRYIPRHDWIGTIFHIVLIVLSVAFAIYFYRLCALTLQGKKKVYFRLKKFWGDRRLFHNLSIALVAVLFSLLSYGAIKGQIPPYHYEERKINLYRIQELVPWAFLKIGYNVFANLGEKDVSEKPFNYWEISELHRLESVKGANLSNSNLWMANLERAFLVNADLRNTNLMFADLSGTNLKNAKLKDAILLGADLRGAKNLSLEQLRQVKTLYRAILDHELMKEVKNTYPYHLEYPEWLKDRRYYRKNPYPIFTVNEKLKQAQESYQKHELQ